ncbi:MAG TPA: DUF58 domain-containing protein, partial [Gemmataceae bacterium]
MVTARGWWFLMVVLLVLAAGVLLPRQGFVLAALGLTLLGWFLWEWLAFAVRVRSSLHRVRLRRRLRSANRDVTLVWAGREFEVSVDVALPRGLPLPYVVVEDRPPLGGALPSGEYRAAAALPPGEPVRLRYHLLCPEPGVVRFEGVRLDVADYQGFFHQRVFLRRPEEYVVLPPLVDVEGRQRTDKYHNLLLPPGVHRLRRPGTGSELLDLRDYRPGDPPKMIAWKPSARRDRLITKEFESEVPIRCTLFLDASQSVRVGPPGRNPLARLVAIGAAVSQAAAAQRDLVGLTVFDEDRVELVRPARGSRHLIDVMVRLSRAARLAPVSSAPDPPALTRAGLLLAGELYPDLLT